MNDATSNRIDVCALSHAAQITAIDRQRLTGGDSQFKAMVQVIVRNAIENAWFSPDVKVASAQVDGQQRWMFVARWDAELQAYVTFDPIQPAKYDASTAQAKPLLSDLRQSFEHWESDHGKWPRAIEKDSNGDYLLMQATSDWRSWQACFEAVQSKATMEG